MRDHGYFSNLIWEIANLLRGPYRPPQYERVMLPMTVLRRFDCVLAPTKAKVLAEHERRKGGKMRGKALDAVLNNTAGQRFHNRSPLDFEKLQGDPDNIAQHLTSYIQGFSADVRRIFTDFFEFGTEIEKMQEANILYLVVSKFRDVDLHPDRVPNEQMGLIFENLIRRFNELANETAGDHFTPREVIRLMVNLLFIHDDELLATPGVVRTLLDPACGTGGMLAEAQGYLRDHNAEAQLYAYGQDYNNRAYAIAASDMLMKQVDHNGGGDNVRFGDSLTEDRFHGQTFDYFLTNPPFGVDWKKQQGEIKREHQSRGFAGRFGAGLPRVNDGALLFLQHMIDKFEPVQPKEHKHGSRLAIVFSGSPLFTGAAGSGESNIRRWIIENDWLEAIVALPEQMFYNTGIATYIWIVANNKERRRKGKIQLLDARGLWTPGGSADSKRSLGDKRRHLSEKQITQIVCLYGRFRNEERSKIFKNEDFGYTRVTVERPLRLRYQMTADRKRRFLADHPDLANDVRAVQRALGSQPASDWNTVWDRIANLLHKRGTAWTKTEQQAFRGTFTDRDPEAEPVVATGPALEPDPQLRDLEKVALLDDVDAYFDREVCPFVPDAWMDRIKDKVGFEINFNRHFLNYSPTRPLRKADGELKRAEEAIAGLFQEVAKRRGMVSHAIHQGLDTAISASRCKLKYLASINDDVLAEDTNATFEMQYIDIGNVDSSGRISGLATYRFEDAPSRARRLVRDGDVIISTVRTYLQAIAQIREPPDNLVVSTGFAVVRPLRDRFDANYCKFALRDAAFLAEVERRSLGVSYPAINAKDLADIQVPSHPLPQQQAIADYLDIETRRLDALLSEVRSVLALLEDRRSAVVSWALGGEADSDRGVGGTTK